MDGSRTFVLARPTRQCPECLGSVPEAARRCACCTVELSTVA